MAENVVLTKSVLLYIAAITICFNVVSHSTVYWLTQPRDSHVEMPFVKITSRDDIGCATSLTRLNLRVRALETWMNISFRSQEGHLKNIHTLSGTRARYSSTNRQEERSGRSDVARNGFDRHGIPADNYHDQSIDEDHSLDHVVTRTTGDDEYYQHDGNPTITKTGVPPAHNVMDFLAYFIKQNNLLMCNSSSMSEDKASSFHVTGLTNKDTSSLRIATDMYVGSRASRVRRALRILQGDSTDRTIRHINRGKKTKPSKKARRIKIRLASNASLDDVIATVNIMDRQLKDMRSAAHFYASVDMNEQVRLRLQGGSLKGEFSDGSFKLEGRIFNIWKPQFLDKRGFSFNRNTGKLKVKKSGIYFIYAQVIFYDDAARKSAGIHVEDELMPHMECLSFDVQSRHKRSPILHHVRKRDHQERHVKLYHQCSMSGLVSIEKGQHVFIKSLEKGRGFLPRKILTYWGITKVGQYT